MAKLPMSVHIASVKYKLTEISVEEHLSSEMYGEFHAGRREIKVATQGQPADVADTLIHELLHALWHTWKLDEHKDDEERIVSSLASGLVHILIDNVALSKYINRCLTKARDTE